jgi:hypothetical protein
LYQEEISACHTLTVWTGQGAFGKVVEAKLTSGKQQQDDKVALDQKKRGHCALDHEHKTEHTKYAIKFLTISDIAQATEGIMETTR